MTVVVERNSEAGTLTIRSGDAAIEFSDLEYPHDALALYRVELSGDGLQASGSVEAIGDDGLAEFLKEMSVSSPWKGNEPWRALPGLGSLPSYKILGGWLLPGRLAEVPPAASD